MLFNVMFVCRRLLQIRFSRVLRLTALALAIVLNPGQGRAHYIDLRDDLVAPDTLTVGVTLVGRPFLFKDNGVLRGFEADWAGAVAQSRGLEIELIQFHRDALLPALSSRKVDAIMTLGLEQPVLGDNTLLPYLRVGDHVMVLRGNPFQIRDLSDLAGHTVSSTAGSSAEAFAHELNLQYAQQNRPLMHIHSFPAQRHAHVPVSMGHAAGLFLKTQSAVALSVDSHARLRLVDGLFRPLREAGLAIRASDENLQDAIAHAIAAKLAAGTYDRLLETHGLPQDLSPFK